MEDPTGGIVSGQKKDRSLVKKIRKEVWHGIKMCKLGGGVTRDQKEASNEKASGEVSKDRDRMTCMSHSLCLCLWQT